jgi:hypothetical protein
MPYSKLNSTTISPLRISNKNRINELKKIYDLSGEEIVDMLLDTFEGDRIDLVIKNLKEKHKKGGLTAKHYTQLSILFTLLRHIIQPRI